MYSTDINNAMQKNNYSFLNVDPFPFTNANLDDPINMPPLDDEDGYETSPSFTKKTLSKAERRAEHNAIERARRESLNNKFQQLAQALPNLMNYRRPSKSQIVEKALDWVKKSISREERYRYQVIQLQKENKRLLAQLMANSTSSTSPTTSISTPTTTTTNEIHHLQYQRQQPNVTPSPSTTTASSHSSSSIRHPFIDFTTTTSIPELQQQNQSLLYDLPPQSSWLSTQSPPSLTSHTYASMDDLHHVYDRKDLDPVVFQSPSTELYLDSMMISNTNKFPTNIQPMVSRSTPAFSSSRRR
ncbi:uncharacterized protein BX664DRAFT_385293 [Halteromyces radiatus]|uniref:uncharacterized protein n=1 Tax=Halteromyces radiatus TaxID=101107 RepID=UPI0022211E08|nr:uncharacterized protein BX664DRAFT_385293 [Halteromyces radiatus]KAI8088674.1 hypothetical protein BX664DRAFT_385293 [Halteromyces radiatus]